MKLVSESLNELYKFEKKSNSLDSLNIGRKALIIKWLDEMDVEDYTINDDYTINVHNWVDLYNKNLVEFPEYIQFYKIEGSFTCTQNKFISLRGCPEQVAGYFACSNNNLISLEGCPKFVNGDFICKFNKGIQITEEDVRKICKIKGYITIEP
jgi:hypothetical protein